MQKKKKKKEKKNANPYDQIRALLAAKIASGEAHPHLSHVNPRVLGTVHAKFHANWFKL